MFAKIIMAALALLSYQVRTPILLTLNMVRVYSVIRLVSVLIMGEKRTQSRR